MAEFLEFLLQHMLFTEKMIYNTVWIGDVVEQSIRHTNMEQFKKNVETDKRRMEEYERVKEALAAERRELELQNAGFSSCASGAPPDDAAESSFAGEDAKHREFRKSCNHKYKFLSID